jgi:hypothetical protein
MSTNATKLKRIFSIIADEYGVDPLKDKLAPGIAAIDNFEYYTIDYSERGSPDAIAYKFYRTHDLWWVIMEYNGLHSYKQIVEGITIKIPAIADVILIAGFQSNRDVYVKRVIEI